MPSANDNRDDDDADDGTCQSSRADGGGAEIGGTDAWGRTSRSVDQEKHQTVIEEMVAATAAAAAGPYTPLPVEGASLVQRTRLAAEGARTSGAGAVSEGVPGYSTILRRTLEDSPNNRWVQCGSCKRWLHEVSIEVADARCFGSALNICHITVGKCTS